MRHRPPIVLVFTHLIREAGKTVSQPASGVALDEAVVVWRGGYKGRWGVVVFEGRGFERRVAEEVYRS